MIRKVIIFVSLGAGTVICSAQSGANRPTSLECVDLLQIPRYPPVARQARLAGVARVHVSTISGESAAGVEVSGVPRILRQAVERALTTSKFSARCRNGGVDFIFVFKVSGQPTEINDFGSVTFRWPNEFVISVPPAATQP